MALELVAIVRHGEYDTYYLNPRGEAQMRALATGLLPLVGGRKLAVISSTIRRAVQSACLLAEGLGAPRPILYEVLVSHDECRPDLPVAYALITRESEAGAAAVIVVTHMEYTEELPSFVCQQLGISGVHLPRRLQKGQAWILNVATKEAFVA